MNEYYLKRIGNSVRVLYIVFNIAILFGVLAFVFLWKNHPSIRLEYFALVFVLVRGMWFYYLISRKNCTLKINDGNFIIANKTGIIEGRINFKDIALIQYDRSVNLIWALVSKNPINETIIIFSNVGKVVFVSSGYVDSIEHNRFIADICGQINAEEKIDYEKQMKGEKVYKNIYVNPLHEDSSFVKKKIWQSKYWYPEIIVIAIIIFIIITFVFGGR